MRDDGMKFSTRYEDAARDLCAWALNAGRVVYVERFGEWYTVRWWSE